MAVEIVGSGMITAVGFSAPATCAAIRAGIDGFGETRFKFDGQWLLGAEVPLADGTRGRARLLRLAAHAVDEALTTAPVRPRGAQLILCLPAPQLGGAPELDSSFVVELRGLLRHEPLLTKHVEVFRSGRVGAIDGLSLAEERLARGEVTHCVVAGVDSLLRAELLREYHADRRLLTAKNHDGFIPGEAAAAVLLAAPGVGSGTLRWMGIGRGREPSALDPNRPLRAQGMTDACREAFTRAQCGYEALDYRIADISGEQRRFKEAALTLARTMRVRKETFDLWHPADCVGEVGAAAVPLCLGVALAAAHKRYAPGPGVLCLFSGDDEQRAAMVLRAADGAARAGGGGRVRSE